MKTTGIGLIQILLIIFIVLKLVGAITWSWWWILSPLWLSLCFIFIVIFSLILILGPTTVTNLLNKTKK